MSNFGFHFKFPNNYKLFVAESLTKVFSSTSLCHREAMGVVLHKDSKWYQQWKDFKDNNTVFNRKYIYQPNGKNCNIVKYFHLKRDVVA